MASGDHRTSTRIGPIIAYADGVTSGRTSPWDVAARCGLRDDPQALLGWVPVAPEWVDDERLSGVALMGGYSLAGPITAGRLRYLPVRLGAVPKVLAGTLRPAVAVVAGVARGDGFAYRGDVGWSPQAVELADVVVVEVDPEAPDLGAPVIARRPDHVIELDPQPPQAQVRAPDKVDLAVGRNVVSLLPDEATIQLGPGGIAEAIIASVDRPVGLWSGLLVDSMADLHSRGLLRGSAVAAYVWGGAAVARLAAAGRLELRDVGVTHGLGVLSQIPGFVGCNTALQIGLDGSVNVERVGGRLVAGVGGHADFCAGASRSPGGLSVIALRSTTRSGASTIVPRVEVVSTPRCDVDVLVTEHGVADLRALDDTARAEAIRDVAAPEHRASLR